MDKHLTDDDLGREIESFILPNDPFGEPKKGKFILGLYFGIMDWTWCIFQINDQGEKIAMWPIDTVTEIVFKEHKDLNEKTDGG